MPYTINLTNGTTLIPGGLPDGTTNTSVTSLTLIGRDYAGYGQFLNENFVYLLENFANGTGPANPLRGQLWWDTANNILRVWSGSSWKISTGATSSPFSSPPSDLSALGGDLWFDTTNNQLKVYSGNSWIVVGPVATPATGNSGAVPAIMQDTTGGNHIVIQFIISSTVYAIISKDTFSSSLVGFPTIVAGLNFSNAAAPSLGINTQSASAVAGTLVLRDGAGGITGTSINGTAVNATTVTASSSLTAPNFTGNVNGNVSATQVTASSITTTGLTATGITGTLSTASQPFITSTGTLTGLQVGTGLSPAITNLYGAAYLNGVGLATLGGSASFSSINNTPIGNAVPSTGAFTTIAMTGAITPSANATINLGASPNQYWGTVFSATTQTGTVNAALVQAGVLSGRVSSTMGNITAIGATSGDFSGNVTAAGVRSTSVVATTVDVSGNVYGAYGIFDNLGTTVVNTLTVAGSLIPSSNLAINLGSTSRWWNNIYGVSIQAKYADLAERFHADAVYSPGTVVELGGSEEITQVVEELSDNVFGVISTNAAYLMNSGAGSNETHPPVAISGRVPVRVTGFVRKGDRLVSAGTGLARSASKTEVTPWNVIGRALQDKTTEGEGLVEAIVKINN